MSESWSSISASSSERLTLRHSNLLNKWSCFYMSISCSILLAGLSDMDMKLYFLLSSLNSSSISAIYKFLKRSSLRSSWSKSSGSTQLSAPSLSRRSKHSVYFYIFFVISVWSVISFRSVTMFCCNFHFVKLRAIFGIRLCTGTDETGGAAVFSGNEESICWTGGTASCWKSSWSLIEYEL